MHKKLRNILVKGEMVFRFSDKYKTYVLIGNLKGRDIFTFFKDLREMQDLNNLFSNNLNWEDSENE